jgi:hypothetical protein
MASHSIRRLSGLGSVLAVLALAACGAEQPATEGDTGTVSLKTVVPTGVSCVRFVLSNSNASTKDFNVAAGASSVSLDLGPLVTGWVLVDPFAFNVACSLVTSATRADWVGDQVGFAVFPGRRTEFAVTLRPNAATTGTVDFVVPVKAIAAAQDTNYALLEDGTVKAWGNGARGQIGDGTFSLSRLTPVAVAGLTNVKAIAAGSNALGACAIRSDSSLVCWGDNTFGQLGDGTTTSRSVPTPVASSLQFVQVSLSSTHACAVAADWSVSCWGDNSSGQLGNGTTVSRLTPSPRRSAPGSGRRSPEVRVTCGQRGGISKDSLETVPSPIGRCPARCRTGRTGRSRSALDGARAARSWRRTGPCDAWDQMETALSEMGRTTMDSRRCL